MIDTNQWSSANAFVGATSRPDWLSPEHRDRIAAYTKYDQIYWNETSQFSLRVLEGEQPLYIPNARIVVDTTAHYVLKGLEIVPKGGAELKKALADFLERELFYSRFHTAKLAGVARGDFAFHLTANPKKGEGTRLSLNSVDPRTVFPTYDDDVPDKMTKCYIAVQMEHPDDENKTVVHRLEYQLHEDPVSGRRRVSRKQDILELDNDWYTPKAKVVKTVLPFGYLDDRITSIPIYWFKNRAWDGEEYGASELRGFEPMFQAISQGSTDVAGALSLEGLGVYATDGGRPVDDAGVEVDWEVSPGRVMEVPQGSYFRRVEGVGSITPATDQIKYLEGKLMESASLSDVALGKVDAQVAQSGIALAIKFMPTLAKIEQRDLAGLGKLNQLFYDWKTWHEVFEGTVLEGDIEPVIGDKLPSDRTARVNELNNMLDRRVISTKFYRDEMAKLGYTFPSSIEKDIEADLDRAKAAASQPKTSEDDEDQDDPNSTEGNTLEKQNSSNNRNRTNESSGTEAE